jgi:hypothetical protein
LIEAEGKLAGADSEPRSGPAAGVIDRIHLARMTLGDKTLEAEVLALFDRQAGHILAQIGRASGPSAALLAHTLAGCARAIGAWKVAAAAEMVGAASRDLGRAALAGAVDELAAAVREAQGRIAKLIGAR